MADTAHSIAHQMDPPIIVERMARLALCGHRTKALHGLTLEMVRVVTAALNELVINPAIGHVGLKGAGELALWVGGDTRP